MNLVTCLAVLIGQILIPTKALPTSKYVFDNIKGNSCTVIQNITNVYVNCSLRGLTHVPTDLPRNATHIDLSHNNIKELGSPFTAFKNSNLTTIDLSFNSIYRVNGSNFKGAENITRLFLNNNQLNVSIYSIAIDRSAFNNFSQLRELKFDHNLWNTTQFYRDDLVTNLASLLYLSMDGLPNAKFEGDFKYLTHLERLDLYGGLKTLDDDTFNGLVNSSIKTLKLLSGQLTSISEGAFLPTPKLQSLDISKNTGLGLNKNISRAWKSLSSTNITELILERITEPTTDLVELHNDFFNYLNNTHLQKLVIDDNHIVKVPGDLCKHLPNLTHISAKYNRLTVDTLLNLTYDIPRCKNMSHIDINFQTITKDRYKRQTTNETVMHIADTQGRNHKNGFQNPTAFVNPKYFFFPPRLNTLKMADTLVVTDVSPRIVFMGKSNLTLVDFSRNRISTFKGKIDFQYLPPNKSGLALDLSNNLCTSMTENFVNSSVFKQVETLILHDNQLGAQIQNSKWMLFGTMSKLKHLDLADNMIKDMPKDAFDSNPELEFLNLSGNALRFVTIDFKSLGNIKHIDLSRNILDSLNSTVRSHIESKNVTVDLSDNPFTCTCNTLSFLKWAHEKSDLLHNFDTYVCSFKESNANFGSELQLSVIPQLERECSLKTIIIAVSSAVAAIVLIIAISVVVYRHRWDIRFFCLTLVSNRIKQHLRDAENRVYDYDVFVSYSHKDSRWVTGVLAPYVERGAIEKYHSNESCQATDKNTSSNEKPLKLCIHIRDFDGGGDIQSNIIEYMERSRKVILILTPDFCSPGEEGHWCEYELRFANQMSFDRGYDVILPLYLKKMTKSELSLPVANLMRKKTYLEVPPNIANLEIFEYDESVLFEDEHSENGPLLRDRKQKLLSDVNILPKLDQDNFDFWRKVRSSVKTLEPRKTTCQCGREWQDGFDADTNPTPNSGQPTSGQLSNSGQLTS